MCSRRPVAADFYHNPVVNFRVEMSCEMGMNVFLGSVDEEEEKFTHREYQIK